VEVAPPAAEGIWPQPALGAVSDAAQRGSGATAGRRRAIRRNTRKPTPTSISATPTTIANIATFSRAPTGRPTWARWRRAGPPGTGREQQGVVAERLAPGSPRDAIESGPDHLGGLLRDLEQGFLRRLAFVVPRGPGWPLPAYELALMTARRAWEVQTGATITLVTPEVAPLAIFGRRATEAVRGELEAAHVGFYTGADVSIEKAHALTVVVHPGSRRIEVDRVVALPRLVGRASAGIPCDEDGFVHVDAQCQVTAVDHVWAAGDGIAFPVKFGGLAADQADAAAEAIAQLADADVTPEPFRPVLRGRLLTWRGDRYLHHVAGGGGGDGEVADHALWWPPGKVAGRRLAPYLAERDEAAAAGDEPPRAGLTVQSDLTRKFAAKPV
jgi:sulfide:quinone oxidoreductase